MKNLEGKRVLLFAPRFFGYEIEIRSEIERRGAIVDFMADRPFDSPLMTALTRVQPRWILPSANKLYEKQLIEIGSTHYDIILVVNGQTLSSNFLKILKTSYSNAKMVLYVWDSLENRQGIVSNLCGFDEVFSFDSFDATYYGLRLRGLFYSKGFERPLDDEIDFHLSFVGTAHSDRYSVVTKLKASLASELSCFWYLYLQAQWVLYAYRAIDPSMSRAQSDEFYFVALSKADLHNVFSRSRAILDIEHPKQHGLTMRTFETIGANKKLITTNPQVRDYDFFNEQNILVIDRSNPMVSREFLESSYVPIGPDIYHRYSIEGWVNEVLGLS